MIESPVSKSMNCVEVKQEHKNNHDCVSKSRDFHKTTYTVEDIKETLKGNAPEGEDEYEHRSCNENTHASSSKVTYDIPI